MPTPSAMLAVLAMLLVSAAAAAVCARAAVRRRWFLRHTRRAPGERTWSRPRVGGTALAIALGVAAALLPAGNPLGAFFTGDALERLGSRWLGVPVEVSVPAGLLAAFGVGLADDLRARGLAPLAKLAGQLLAGLALGAPMLAELARTGAPSAALALAGLALLAVLAQNAVNTFDNCDGAAAAVAALGLALPAPIAAAPLIGFLLVNLPRANRERSLTAPILGDSGSHLVGMCVACVPLAWPALALPLLDLARVALGRVRSGRAPWRGDRTHLAHRLLTGGLSPLATLALLVAIAAPASLLGARALELWEPRFLLHGLALTALLFVLALQRTARRAERRSRARHRTSVAGS